MPLIDGYFSIIFIQANQVEFYTNSNPTYPLYYYSQNDDLWISNEVKHLTRNKPINSVLRPLIDFNPRSFYDGSFTIFKYIERIALNSHLTCFMNDDQSINIACSLYKKTDLIINYSNRNKILSCLDYLFESITKSLVNYSCKNNNIGVALSGGVDSSLIAGYIRQCYPNANIHCFTVRRDDKNEFDYAKLCSKYINGIYHQITIDESMFVDGMMNMIYYNEMFDAFSVEVYSPLNSIYTKAKIILKHL